MKKVLILFLTIFFCCAGINMKGQTNPLAYNDRTYNKKDSDRQVYHDPITSIIDRVQLLLKERKILLNTIDDLENTIADLENIIAKKDYTIAKKNKKIENLEKVIKSLKKKKYKDNDSDVIKSQRVRIQELERDNKRLKKELKGMEMQVNQLSQEKRDLSKKNDFLEKENQRLQEMNEQLDIDNIKLINKIDSLTHLLEKDQIDKNTHKKHIKNLKRVIRQVAGSKNMTTLFYRKKWHSKYKHISLFDKNIKHYIHQIKSGELNFYQSLHLELKKPKDQIKLTLRIIDEGRTQADQEITLTLRKVEDKASRLVNTGCFMYDCKEVFSINNRDGGDRNVNLKDGYNYIIEIVNLNNDDQHEVFVKRISIGTY